MIDQRRVGIKDETKLYGVEATRQDCTRPCAAGDLMNNKIMVRASLDSILKWDFDRILVGHGRNIETGGKAALRSQFSCSRRKAGRSRPVQFGIALLLGVSSPARVVYAFDFACASTNTTHSGMTTL
jgi:hypothetical protein